MTIAIRTTMSRSSNRNNKNVHVRYKTIPKTRRRKWKFGTDIAKPVIGQSHPRWHTYATTSSRVKFLHNSTSLPGTGPTPWVAMYEYRRLKSPVYQISCITLVLQPNDYCPNPLFDGTINYSSQVITKRFLLNTTTTTTTTTTCTTTATTSTASTTSTTS